MVQRLRLSPLTAATGVRFPTESPTHVCHPKRVANFIYGILTPDVCSHVRIRDWVHAIVCGADTLTAIAERRIATESPTHVCHPKRVANFIYGILTPDVCSHVRIRDWVHAIVCGVDADYMQVAQNVLLQGI